MSCIIKIPGEALFEFKTPPIHIYETAFQDFITRWFLIHFPRQIDQICTVFVLRPSIFCLKFNFVLLMFCNHLVVSGSFIIIVTLRRLSLLPFYL